LCCPPLEASHHSFGEGQTDGRAAVAGRVNKCVARLSCAADSGWQSSVSMNVIDSFDFANVQLCAKLMFRSELDRRLYREEAPLDGGAKAHVHAVSTGHGSISSSFHERRLWVLYVEHEYDRTAHVSTGHGSTSSSSQEWRLWIMYVERAYDRNVSTGHGSISSSSHERRLWILCVARSRIELRCFLRASPVIAIFLSYSVLGTYAKTLPRQVGFHQDSPVIDVASYVTLYCWYHPQVSVGDTSHVYHASDVPQVIATALTVTFIKTSYISALHRSHQVHEANTMKVYIISSESSSIGPSCDFLTVISSRRRSDSGATRGIPTEPKNLNRTWNAYKLIPCFVWIILPHPSLRASTLRIRGVVTLEFGEGVVARWSPTTLQVDGYDWMQPDAMIPTGMQVCQTSIATTSSTVLYVLADLAIVSLFSFGATPYDESPVPTVNAIGENFPTVEATDGPDDANDSGIMNVPPVETSEVMYAYIVCRLIVVHDMTILSHFSWAPSQGHYQALKDVVKCLHQMKDWNIAYRQENSIESVLWHVPLPSVDVDVLLTSIPVNEILPSDRPQDSSPYGTPSALLTFILCPVLCYNFLESKRLVLLTA